MASLLSIVWDIDPAIFRIGPVEVRYYGLAWAFALGVSAFLFQNFIKREGYSDKMFDSIFWYGVLGTIIGARLGHCFFYDFDYYSHHLFEVLYFWEGGLASHGAAAGLLLGLWLWSRKWKMPYVWSLDRIGIGVAIGGAAVRLGNLMNSEIYGTETDMPWGFVFVRAGETLPKHPTQIYEALAYTIIFVIMWWMYYKRDLARKRPGVLFGFFLITLFGARIVIEMIKNPQVAFEENMSLYMGQILSIPFVIAGAVILWLALRKPEVEVHAAQKTVQKQGSQKQGQKQTPHKK